MADGAKLVSAAQQAFARIGTRNGHAFPENEVVVPEGLSNEEVHAFIEKERVAFRFMIAGELRSMAEKSYKNAKQDAEDYGLFEGIDTINPGSSATLYTGPIVSIAASVNNPTKSLDKTKLKNELRKAGVSEKTVNDALDKASTENSPAKRITATPVL